MYWLAGYLLEQEKISCKCLLCCVNCTLSTLKYVIVRRYPNIRRSLAYISVTSAAV